MFQFPIGVMLESFLLPVDEALDRAAALGLQGVQVYATRGDFSPERFHTAERQLFMRKLKDRGLVISALCGDLGKAFDNPSQNPQLIDQSKAILDLAKELGTDIVTTHIGVVPTDAAHPRYKIMQDACYQLAQYADSLQAHFAVETGPETAEVLKGFLDSLHSRGVAVNMDPANFVMVTGDDPVQAVHTLKDYIVHTHAKDGVRLAIGNPEVIYHVIEEELGKMRYFEEVPLGKGGVDFPRYVQALEEIGYRGFLTIEREVGKNPEADIHLAASFLRNILGGL